MQERLRPIIDSKNLIRLVIGLPLGIFFSEVIAMVLVYFIDVPYHITVMIDAVVTTSMMLPIIYFLSYRPLLRNIAERERANQIIEFRLRLIQFGMIHSLEELLQFILDEIQTLIGAEIGFFHFLEADQKTLWLHSWSTNTKENLCKVEIEGDGHYDLDQAGIWADCARLKKPVVHNDYQSLENVDGLPLGHAPIIRELTIPIIRNDLVVGILGIGNKPQAFSEQDVEVVTALADFAWDIIVRKRTEDALIISEEKFRTLADWTNDWESWVDADENYVYISPSCESISGYCPEEFISQPSLANRIIYPEDRKLYQRHRKLIHDKSAGVSNVEYRIIDRDGNVHWIDHICRPLYDNQGKYLGRRASNREITQRKLAEKEAIERKENEFKLTQMLQTMQLEIARDLHDTIGQSIGYLRMRLDHLNETNMQSKLNLNNEILNMLKVANESYDLIRGTLDMLQTGRLEDPLSLFMEYSTQIEERSSFEIVVTSHGRPKPLSPSKTRQIFFVYREALSNIEKHADASKVEIDINWDEKEFVITIKDDGNGFVIEEISSDDHYGLKFMQERVDLMKGRFSVRSMDGDGTTIMVAVPYD